MAALMLLNDPQYVEAARAFAQRSMNEGAGKPANVAETMLHMALLRDPEPAEVDRLVGLYEASLTRYQANPEAAKQLLSIGEAPVNGDAAPADLAAWTLAANAVLNFDELLNKE